VRQGRPHVWKRKAATEKNRLHVWYRLYGPHVGPYRSVQQAARVVRPEQTACVNSARVCRMCDRTVDHTCDRSVQQVMSTYSRVMSTGLQVISFFRVNLLNFWCFQRTGFVLNFGEIV
jgi:hypothetical protein